ncbi:MarR family winged helix-turn-helix transcriptional regulator [Streptococcus suis]|uniref:MarR family winged helix-turn-helix transcriptional regulator n=1 Tax=Streptococcus suis TaxID=1307 RepID=UPI00211B81BE|nr:MarR family transcriptional regulator [Streptococcus suis]MCQ9225729.1 MarR family transcriptional regulator [Streptococcus suis]MCQ9227983.1 MarR family transcriptional regulator [Streptococcus suis]MCQ9242060.1 MarR family transcriptional regulator [Streptococcus suis]MCQ9274293.1 MarR family transcriptional regulator [Streptococcus suis]MDE7534593.1 MarR family transcriptional regulator [Streptococcus suis]
MSDYHYSKQLCYSFYQVNKLFNQFYLKNLKEFDLTYTQYLVLVVLWEKAPLTLKELGEKLDLASNTLTPLLKRLEAKGYIQRSIPLGDKRQLLIQLTEDGQKLQTSLEDKLLSCFRQLDGLTIEKKQSYVKYNQELIESLQNYLD